MGSVIPPDLACCIPLPETKTNHGHFIIIFHPGIEFNCYATDSPRLPVHSSSPFCGPVSALLFPDLYQQVIPERRMHQPPFLYRQYVRKCEQGIYVAITNPPRIEQAQIQRPSNTTRALEGDTILKRHEFEVDALYKGPDFPVGDQRRCASVAFRRTRPVSWRWTYARTSICQLDDA